MNSQNEIKSTLDEIVDEAIYNEMNSQNNIESMVDESNEQDADDESTSNEINSQNMESMAESTSNEINSQSMESMAESTSNKINSQNMESMADENRLNSRELNKLKNLLDSTTVKKNKLNKRISTNTTGASVKKTVKKIRPVKMPTKQILLNYMGSEINKAYDTDAGYDLRISEQVACPKGVPVILEYASKICVPYGYYGLLNARSSINQKGTLRTGIVDAGYTGTLKSTFVADEDLLFEANTRIAQLVIIPIANTKPNKVENFEISDRGEKGFGSSGTN